MTADNKKKDKMGHPNLLFVFGDQWRAQAFGYAGNPNVRTPRIDRFASESISFVNATSGVPVCSPYRASLLTGQYPLTHGIIVNDQSIRSQPVSFAEALKGAGYHTSYVGKWHVDGRGRQSYVPPERRLGFDEWLGFECSHDYYNSPYYADNPEKSYWDGYDAEAQTQVACEILRTRMNKERPTALFLSWGPPHDPYREVPEEYLRLYDPAKLKLRPNVPTEAEERARKDLAGYYAHCTALDDFFGKLLDELEATGLADDTIVIFTSDHGDMHGSHGVWRKQHPFDESVVVPLLIRYPRAFSRKSRVENLPINAPDMMPTILGLCGVEIPETVEGVDFSPAVREEAQVDDGGAYLACYRPFHEMTYNTGGRDYRGLRNERYTYCRDHEGPWLLFDNREDPFQLRNLVKDPSKSELVAELDAALQRKLDRLNDGFLTGDELCRIYDVALNAKGDVVVK
jgi:arylsulfatase A-like enzyme